MEATIMSDLTAANCGCNNDYGVSPANENGGCSWIWILLLVFFFSGNGFGRSGNGCGCNGNGIFGRSGNGNNSCCEWLIWILLLSTFCGN